MFIITPEVFFLVFLLVLMLDCILYRTNRRAIQRNISAFMVMVLLFAAYALDNNHSIILILLAIPINLFVILFLLDDPKKKEHIG